MKKKFLKIYEFDNNKGRLNYRTLEGWLSKAYWSPNIKKAEIKKGALNSTLVAGCYLGAEQVGYLRIVSDKTRFAYIMDVFVAPGHRKKGIAQNLLLFAMGNPSLKDVFIWMLGTRDAHRVYEKIGFQPLPHPEKWMILRK